MPAMAGFACPVGGGTDCGRRHKLWRRAQGSCRRSAAVWHCATAAAQLNLPACVLCAPLQNEERLVFSNKRVPLGLSGGSRALKVCSALGQVIHVRDVNQSCAH